jgi:hypothetical protein
LQNQSRVSRKYASGDERHPPVPAADRLPLALPAAGQLCAALEVYNTFRKFQRDGVWEAIWAELHMALRERMDREASQSAAVLDSQSVQSAEKGAGTTAGWAMMPESGSRGAGDPPICGSVGYVPL